MESEAVPAGGAHQPGQALGFQGGDLFADGREAVVAAAFVIERGTPGFRAA